MISDSIFITFAVSCGGVLSGVSGEISSPNYPQPYPTNITCTWKIRGGSSHVNLTFLDFEVSKDAVRYANAKKDARTAGAA